MTTLGQVVSSVRHRLSGAGAVTEQVTALSDEVDASALSLPVVEAKFGAGVVEVGMEQMRVRSASQADGSLELWPFGRGYSGTVPAEHPAGSEVVLSPRWAASTVASEINGVLTELYPALYAVNEVEQEYTELRDGDPFTLPAGTVGVVAVFLPSATVGGWVRTDEWRYEPDAGRTLWVKRAVRGSVLRVVYASRPGLFDLQGSISQDFVEVTGLPERASDVLALGVAYRLASMVDLAGNASLGSAARSDMKEQSTGSQVARLLFAQFQARVEQERMALLKEHPVRPNRERS